jgi:hypothetical protein
MSTGAGSAPAEDLDPREEFCRRGKVINARAQRIRDLADHGQESTINDTGKSRCSYPTPLIGPLRVKRYE